MIEMIFLLSVFAEIAITTSGGPGNASTNMTYLIFKQALMNFDVGVASAGALFAVVLANIVAVFLIRIRRQEPGLRGASCIPTTLPPAA